MSIFSIAQDLRDAADELEAEAAADLGLHVDADGFAVFIRPDGPDDALVRFAPFEIFRQHAEALGHGERINSAVPMWLSFSGKDWSEANINYVESGRFLADQRHSERNFCRFVPLGDLPFPEYAAVVAGNITGDDLIGRFLAYAPRFIKGFRLRDPKYAEGDERPGSE